MHGTSSFLLSSFTLYASGEIGPSAIYKSFLTSLLRTSVKDDTLRETRNGFDKTLAPARKRSDKLYDETDNRAHADAAISVPLNKRTWKCSTERSSRFRNAARALFSSYVAPFSRRLVSPFSRSSVGQRGHSHRPLSNARLLRISSPSPRRSIDPTDGGDAGTFSTCSEANGPTSPFPQYVRKIRETEPSAKPAKSRLFLDFSYKSQILTYASCVFSSVNYCFT